LALKTGALNLGVLNFNKGRVLISFFEIGTTKWSFMKCFFAQQMASSYWQIIQNESAILPNPFQVSFWC
jgi:hypothetical protein